MFNTYDATKPYYNQMGYSEHVLERFWSKVDVKKLDDGTDDLDACMEWTAGFDKDKYGCFSIINKQFRTHRFIYECYNGSIPKDLLVCHSCDNPSCVNPKHLWIGTNQENTQDRHNKGRSSKGSKIATSKLIESDVKNILIDIYKEKYNNIGEISNKYSLKYISIYNILNGKLWTHVSDDVCKELNCDLLDLKNKISKTNIGNSSKLSRDEVLEIVDLLKADVSQTEIANIFLVDISTISMISIGKNWSNVTGIKYQKSGPRKGSLSKLSKLTEEQVREIKIRLRNGEKGYILADEFNVKSMAISRIKNNKSWKHVII
jgi:hypothetical protein